VRHTSTRGASCRRSCDWAARRGLTQRLADYLVDRWDKARMLGFGEDISAYDSCLVIGDVKVGKGCWIGPFAILDGYGGLTIGDCCTISEAWFVGTKPTFLVQTATP
jgi:hypothetical protein